MNPKVWEATGHVANFHDPLVDCKYCHARFRADDLVKSQMKDVDVDGLSQDQLNEIVQSGKIVCPTCGKNEFTPIRQFQMMFKTFIGVTEEKTSTVYLRPETAQGIFVNFKNVVRTTRRKLPLGICDIGKAFRNEITPGNFTFRTREFEQMEIEFFFKPGEDEKWFAFYKDNCKAFVEKLGLKEDKVRFRDHEPQELAFYSKATTDIEYLFPTIGWGELMGIACRGDYDLTRHQTCSTQDLTYLDPDDNTRYIPHVVEPSFGLDRLMLALCCNAYDVESLDDGKDSRIVMHLEPELAPYTVAVMPLSNKLNEAAKGVFDSIREDFDCIFDTTGSIGKRYRREDAIGTPFCVTYDFDSATDQKVTIRERDSMKQERILISDLSSYIRSYLAKNEVR
jgi:glycyl-tRNA synthetase